MTDLNDLFKVIAEGKKEYEETDPVGIKLKQVKENVKSDLGSLFAQLTSLKEDLEKELVVAEAKQEQAPMITEEIPAQPIIHTPEVRAAQVDADVNKYLTDKSFQNPQPDIVNKDVEAIRNKIKFLEQAIGRIAAAGPGSGEVNFRWLDDVNRATMTPSNNNWVLEYDSATKKVQFTENIGPIEDINTHTASVTSLTKDRIVLVGDGGELIDDANLTFDGTDFILNGNMTVNGDITYINTSTLDVTDKNITIAKGATGPTIADGAGISVDGANANITYRNTGDAWEFNKNVIPSGNYDKNLGATGHQWGQVYANNINLKSMLFDLNGATGPLQEGQLAWNSTDKTIDVKQNQITQQVGQESYALVRNRTGFTITNGAFVRFAGAEENGVARVLVEPFLANGTYPNLFGLGVATEDILDDEDGFVTVFGKVRGLNTTNTGITSETWVAGDILYASPTTAGKLTKIKPTAPNNVIPVAAVLRVHSQIGELFVRPTYEQKRTYGTFADKTNQYAAEAATVNPNAVYPVTFNTTEVANGHRRGTDTSQIISEASGLFNYQFSMQFVSTNSAAKEVYIWFRKNGNDIPDSASRITITGNDVYSVAAWDITVSMNVNDYFQIMWAVTNTSVHISAPVATAFCPAIPSVLLTVSEVAL